MKIILGLIGAGRIAGAHAEAVESLGGRVEIAAVVDPVETARESMAQRLSAKAYPSLESLLRDESQRQKLQGLIVCTPPSQRVELVRQARDAGLAVLTEKPLAHRLDDCDTLCELAQMDTTLPAVVGFCHRFTPAVAKMAEIANAGELGRLIRIENVFASHIEGMDTHWMSDPTMSGGGSLVDTGLHSFDLVTYLAGDAVLEGAVLSHAWPGRGDSNATVLLRTLGENGLLRAPEGLAAQIISGWAEPSRFLLRLVGSMGMLSYDYERGEDLELRLSSGVSETLQVEDHGVRFARQLDGFCDMVKAPSKPTRLCSFVEARENMRVLAKIGGALHSDRPAAVTV